MEEIKTALELVLEYYVEDYRNFCIENNLSESEESALQFVQDYEPLD